MVVHTFCADIFFVGSGYRCEQYFQVSTLFPVNKCIFVKHVTLIL
jgi:hypothetical protein